MEEFNLHNRTHEAKKMANVASVELAIGVWTQEKAFRVHRPQKHCPHHLPHHFDHMQFDAKIVERIFDFDLPVFPMP